jgi:hypothetical protein
MCMQIDEARGDDAAACVDDHMAGFRGQVAYRRDAIGTKTHIGAAARLARAVDQGSVTNNYVKHGILLFGNNRQITSEESKLKQPGFTRKPGCRK